MKSLLTIIVLVYSSLSYAETSFPIVNSETYFRICSSGVNSFDAARAAGEGSFDNTSIATCLTYINAYIAGYRNAVYASSAKIAVKGGAGTTNERYDKSISEFMEICLDGNSLQGDPLLVVRTVLDYFEIRSGSIKKDLGKVVYDALSQRFPCA